MRYGYLDKARGLAIACMVADHIALLVGGLEGVRWTIGRLAMPVFFLLAGRLVRRLTWRTAAVGALGLALPVAVPWIDSPNVLLWWAVGAVLVVAARRVWWGTLMLLIVCLALLGNGVMLAGDGYPPAALVGFMALGNFVGPVELWRRFDRLPAVLEAVGRAPVRWYVGHLAALQAAAIAVIYVRGN